MTHPHDTIPFGYCRCGCGQKTAIADRTDPRYGAIKGEPRRFVNHHANVPHKPVPTIALIPGKPFALIRCGNGKSVVVDRDDADRLVQSRVYVVRNNGGSWSARTRRSRLLSHLVIQIPKGMVPDHINGNELDNRRQNLRAATHQQNSWNCKKSVRNTSGFIGVWRTPKSGRWRSTIYADGKTIYLGTFDTAEEAGRAYQQAASRLRGEFHRRH